jgi:competence CoiA-like predicted nuclease
MSNNHLYARRKSDGDKVFIDDIPNGKKCGCICSKCHEPLIAKNGGEINIHHFAHISDSNCTGETEAHFEAKEIIKREKYLWLPNYNESKKVEFDDVQVECLIKNSKYRADLLCTAKGKEIAVEIVVTHDLDADKKSYLMQEKVTTLTIDLSKDLTKDEYYNLPENFSDMVLKTSNRRWFYNAKIEAIKDSDKLELKRKNEERKKEFDIEFRKYSKETRKKEEADRRRKKRAEKQKINNQKKEEIKRKKQQQNALENFKKDDKNFINMFKKACGYTNGEMENYLYSNYRYCCDMKTPNPILHLREKMNHDLKDAKR